MKKIVIATGIYPPAIGGPAQYAKGLKEALEKKGHAVSVMTYRIEKKLPPGFRHLLFFARCFLAFPGKDFVIALDAFSAGFPAMLAAKLFRKKVLVRIGGDFLWEWYVERTGDLVLLRHFYEESPAKFTRKERLIFRLTRWTVRAASRVIFSTEWQRRIWLPVYNLQEGRCLIIENYFGPKERSYAPETKNFLAGTRPLKWKNPDRLKEAFDRARLQDASLVCDAATAPFSKFMEKIARCYAVILVSLGDVSPNMILDAIRHDKPFILTRETGLRDRLRDVGLFVDPESVEDIAQKIILLSQPAFYEERKKKIEAFAFTHTWEDIAGEFLRAFETVA